MSGGLNFGFSSWALGLRRNDDEKHLHNQSCLLCFVSITRVPCNQFFRAIDKKSRISWLRIRTSTWRQREKKEIRLAAVSNALGWGASLAQQFCGVVKQEFSLEHVRFVARHWLQFPCSPADTWQWSTIAVGFFNSIMFPSIFALGVAELGPLTGKRSHASWNLLNGRDAWLSSWSVSQFTNSQSRCVGWVCRIWAGEL
jgi:hypothetical protein